MAVRLIVPGSHSARPWTPARLVLLLLLGLPGAGCGLLTLLLEPPEAAVEGADAGADEAGIADGEQLDAGGLERMYEDGSRPDSAAPERPRDDIEGVDLALLDGGSLDLAAADRGSLDLLAADRGAPDLTQPDAAPATWHDIYAACRARVDIDTSNLTEPLYDFTLLAPLDPDRLVCGASAVSPYHIGFYDADGGRLAHELEDGRAGEPTPVWVRVPEIADAPGRDHIWLYFGSGVSPSPLGPEDAWGLQFRGVWHLDELLEQNWYEVHDSTWFGNHGDNEGGMSAISRSTGKIGYSQFFDGANDHLAIGDAPGGALDFAPDESFTYSLWVQAIGSGSDSDMPWYKGGAAAHIPGYDLELGTGCWAAGLSDGSYNQLVCFDPPASPRWVHLAVAVDRADLEVRVYMDGARAMTQPLREGFDVQTQIGATIGADPYGDYAFYGYIDEVRVEQWAHTDERNAAEHRSMTGALVTFGTVEIRS